EAQGGVTLSGTVTGLAAGATFLITVTDGEFSKTYTATVNHAGTGWAGKSPRADASPCADATAAFSVQDTHQFGNPSAPATQTFTVLYTLATATTGAHALSLHDALPISEAQGGVTLSGTVTGLAAGATFLITVTDGEFSKTYTATVNHAGTG